jgi:hypothetical protein
MDSKDFEQLRSYMDKQIATLNSAIDNPSLLKPAIAAIAVDIETIIASLEVCQRTIDNLAKNFIGSEDIIKAKDDWRKQANLKGN